MVGKLWPSLGDVGNGFRQLRGGLHQSHQALGRLVTATEDGDVDQRSKHHR
jgi:hypothetical protein